MTFNLKIFRFSNQKLTLWKFRFFISFAFYRFRILEGSANPQSIRDEWIQAIKKGCFRQYQEKERELKKATSISSNDEVVVDSSDRFRVIYQVRRMS